MKDEKNDKQNKVSNETLKEEEVDNIFDNTIDEEIKRIKNEPLINQVIGQPTAVSLLKRAIESDRNVLLIGLPGVGKSMLARATSQMLPIKEQFDLIAKSNDTDPNRPLIKTLPVGESQNYIGSQVEKAKQYSKNYLYVTLMGIFFVFLIMFTFFVIFDGINLVEFLFGLLLIITWVIYRDRKNTGYLDIIPTILVKNANQTPFIDASGSTRNILLGDVKHDPYQSGGLETPSHHLIIPGLIHKAHNGILYIDEIGTLDIETQFHLLTAMEDKKLAIEGRGLESSGSVVKTDKIPCDFSLIAAGNFETLENLHPALRNRIQGYGVEVLMEKYMKITENTAQLLFRFTIQELEIDDLKYLSINNDISIALTELGEIFGRKDGHISLQFRKLGGIIRTARDICFETRSLILNSDTIWKASITQKTVEDQERYRRINEDIKIKSKSWLIGDVWNLQLSENKFCKINVSKYLGTSVDVNDVNYDKLKKLTSLLEDNSIASLASLISYSNDIMIPRDTVFIGEYNDDLSIRDNFRLKFQIYHAYNSNFKRIICYTEKELLSNLYNNIDIIAVNSLIKLCHLIFNRE